MEDNIQTVSMEPGLDTGPVGAGSSLDFDQVEHMTAPTKKGGEPKADKKTEKSEPKAEKSANESEKKEVAAKKSSGEDEEKDAADKVADELKDPAGKLYKFTGADGKPLDLADSSKVKIKVAGKEQEVSVKDLVENFAGKIPWNRKYEQLAREKEEFHTERDEVNRTVGQIATLASEGKPIEALTKLYTAMGADPVAGIKSLVQKIRESAPQLFQGSPEDLASYEQKLENQIYQADRGLRAQDHQATTEKQTLDNYIKGELQKSGMEMTEFLEAYEELVEQNPEKLNAETAIEYALDRRAKKQAEDALIVAKVPDEKITPKLLQVMAKNVRQGAALEDVVAATLNVLGIQNKNKSSDGAKRSSIAQKVLDEGQARKTSGQQPARGLETFDDL